MIKTLKTIGYWTLSLTWGLPMTLIGLIAAVGLLITGHKPHRFHYNIYFEVGNGWGGVDFGAITIVCKDHSLLTIQHEHGHGLQNLWWGVFMLVWGAWSVVRYWHREIVRRSGGNTSKLPPYEAYWLEAQATELGKKYF